MVKWTIVCAMLSSIAPLRNGRGKRFYIRKLLRLKLETFHSAPIADELSELFAKEPEMKSQTLSTRLEFPNDDAIKLKIQ